MAIIFRTAVALACVAALGVPAGAQGVCSGSSMVVDGRTVTASFCVPADPASETVTISEVYSARGRSLTKLLVLTLISAKHTSRAVDDIDLTPLGIARTLHITLAYRAGAVILEHALALPGAFPVK